MCTSLTFPEHYVIEQVQFTSTDKKCTGNFVPTPRKIHSSIFQKLLYM